MQKKNLKACPYCGAELNGEKREDALLNEMSRLKERGILHQTMFVAVRTIQSMSENNPVWLKEALDNLGEDIKDSLQRRIREETGLVLNSVMEIKGNPLVVGRLQEEAVAKRLSSLKLGEDRIITEQSRKSSEDVKCIVMEGEGEIGKIVIEVKHTKKWQEVYVEQLKRYMEKESTKFGILATRTLPDDALNGTVWRNNVLIVKLEYVELAYIFVREHLKLKKSLEKEYSRKFSQLEVRDQILEELKKAITSGELDRIIERINKATFRIDNEVSKAENYMKRVFKSIRKNANSIREITSELVSDHIEKIRTQLIQAPLPPSFL